MIIRKRFKFMEQAAAVAEAGAAAEVAAVAEATAVTAEAAPVDATQAKAVESLLSKPPAADKTAATDAPDWAAKVPEKSRVIGADGQIDKDATLAKLAESYVNLEKHKGALTAAPPTPEEYSFQPPKQFKDMPLDDTLSAQFRKDAHAAGLSNEQYQMVMGKYFELVPGILDSAAKLSAEDGRQALQKAWPSSQQYQAGISAAERAVHSAPEAIRGELWERYGTDPVFIQFAASIGKEMREDRPPGTTEQAGANNGIEALMASKAYRDPKDPQHAAVSAQVQSYFKRVSGSASA